MLKYALSFLLVSRAAVRVPHYVLWVLLVAACLWSGGLLVLWKLAE